jgi:hypothetical protein
MKFAYFAAVGNADFNFPEFFSLRKKFEGVHARYKIRVFNGEHGWAPPEVWMESLDWMDLQAMVSGILPRDAQRIQQSLTERMARAEKLRADGDPLEAAREYQSVVRDFAALADVASARDQLAVLLKDKVYKNAERDEADDVSRQKQLTEKTSSDISAIGLGLSIGGNLIELRSMMADLKKKADAAANLNDHRSLVNRRARQQVVAEAFENGQESADLKKYDDALQYFEVAAAGARHPEWSQYYRAQVYAAKGDKKGVIAALKLSVAAGLSDASALDADEFAPYREMPEFQALVAEVKMKKQ